MSIGNRHVRHGFGAVRPYVYGPADLPDFLCGIFGGVELERRDSSPTCVHVEIRIQDSVVVIEAGDVPADVIPTAASIYVYVDDVDAVFEQALAAGGIPLAMPDDEPCGERRAGFQDSFGNTWWIGTLRPGVTPDAPLQRPPQ